MTVRSWIIAALLFVIYNLNARAIGSRDTHVTEYVALSLATRGDANLDEYPLLVETGLARGYMTSTRSGAVVSNYPMVPALVAAPVYFLAARSGWIDPTTPRPARVEAIGKIVASALTALACGSLFALVSRGHSTGGAAFACAAVALGTPLWSSASQALWTHGPAAAALASALVLSDRKSSGATCAAGAAYGCAAACRPLLVVFMIGAAAYRLRARERGVLWLAAGAAIVLVPLALYNTATFGTPAGGLATLESSDVHRQAHLVDDVWSRNTIDGLAGILGSPSRGILIYSPVLILAAVGAWRMRRDPRMLWAASVPLAAYITLWAHYAVWWGGHSYGPRYAADIAIPAGLLLVHAVPSRLGAAPILLLAWSIAVQGIGVAAYPGGAWNSTPVDVDRAHERLWDWRDPQILRTLKAGLYRH